MILTRCALVVTVCVLLSGSASDAAGLPETSLTSERARLIVQLTSRQEFTAAIDSCRAIMKAEPSNPVGYFLLATAYYSINNQYRNDHYADSVSFCVDTAIALARKQVDGNRNDAESYFVLGSAFGCRALYRSLHSGWWGAFRDGHNSCVNLEKAYDQDASFSDALSGVGAYHYWKSAKAKILTFLPFVGDKRSLGISEILRAIAARGAMTANAQRSLLPIYYEEKRYDAVVAVADSLAAGNLLDPNSRLHLSRALIALKRWDLAIQNLDQVLAEWKKSPYHDPCAESEVLYLKAKIFTERGELSEARKCLDQITSAKTTCSDNQYYQQSLSSANELSR